MTIYYVSWADINILCALFVDPTFLWENINTTATFDVA